ncbi:hypothetical protein HK096_007987, partial [Nowakowskiella sp. JEL0078]
MTFKILILIAIITALTHAAPSGDYYDNYSDTYTSCKSNCDANWKQSDINCAPLKYDTVQAKCDYAKICYNGCAAYGGSAWVVPSECSSYGDKYEEPTYEPEEKKYYKEEKPKKKSYVADARKEDYSYDYGKKYEKPYYEEKKNYYLSGARKENYKDYDYGYDYSQKYEKPYYEEKKKYYLSGANKESYKNDYSKNYGKDYGNDYYDNGSDACLKICKANWDQSEINCGGLYDYKKEE